jgi:carbohydrate diacid regulator
VRCLTEIKEWSRRELIDSLIARRLVERISQYTEYNINIMDDKGTIIASRNASRIGTYHDVAFKIIHGNEDIIIARDDTQPGVRKGVNMAIYYNGRKEGVVGVSGEPDEVMAVAQIIKMSVEVMLEHEYDRYEKARRRNRKEQLLHTLLYEYDIRREDYSAVADSLSLDINRIRIPVLFDIKGDEKLKDDLTDVLRNGIHHSHQDMMCYTRENDIILFKAMDQGVEELIQNYKYAIGEDVSEGLRYLRSSQTPYRLYIGGFLDDFRLYHTGYEQCMWLKSDITHDTGESYCFYDYAADFLYSRIPISDYQKIFGAYENCMDETMKRDYIELIGTLRDSNFNMREASEKMHIHKNTLAYRLDKVKRLLNIDPMNNDDDRELAIGFWYYLSNKPAD